MLASRAPTDGVSTWLQPPMRMGLSGRPRPLLMMIIRGAPTQTAVPRPHGGASVADPLGEQAEGVFAAHTTRQRLKRPITSEHNDREASAAQMNLLAAGAAQATVVGPS
jgi:hypothetical protein